MRRRELLTLLGAGAAWPLVARAQQSDRIRRVGVLTGFSQHDPFGQSLLAAFRQQLAALGWVEGHNIKLEIRWGDAAQPERMRAHAVELARIVPDVIVVHGARALAAVRRETDRVPILFASVADPVASGYVESLARPGGNITGFTNYSGFPSPKLLEALRDIAPRIVRVGFLITPDNPAITRQLPAMESVAQSFGVKVTSLLPRDPGAIARTIADFAQAPDGGLVVNSDVFMITHRDLVIAAAARHRLPAVYQDRSFVAAGGLMSYSVDRKDSYRRVALYVDRILRGAKPGELPVQQPERFEFVLNLKTAKALDIEVPRMLLARADELID
jgi:putative ABC transport system substrate-binding protein